MCQMLHVHKSILITQNSQAINAVGNLDVNRHSPQAGIFRCFIVNKRNSAEINKSLYFHFIITTPLCVGLLHKNCGCVMCKKKKEKKKIK